MSQEVLARTENGRFPRRLGELFFAIPALLLFAQGALTQLDLPGIYLDAVNPDYMVLKLFAKVANTPVWLLPGNLLFGKFPVMVAIYHGALPEYVGLPVYLLFGTGLVGIRLANLLFGLLVLGALAAAMRAFRMNPVIAGLALAALSLDVGFIYAFRTQFYITTLPLALVFASVALTSATASRRRLVVAGALAGLSAYGYFCFFFVIPAVAWNALSASPSEERFPYVLSWGIGLALGVSPFALGLLLVYLNEGGVDGFLSFFKQYLGNLAVVNAMPFAERLRYGGWILVSTAQSFGPMTMMTGGFKTYAHQFKSVLLLGGPLLAFAGSLLPRFRRPAAQTAAFGVAGIYVLFLAFGHRAWLHHAAPALPLLYLGLAALGDQAATLANRRVVLCIAAAPLIALLWVNAIDRQRAQLALESTGGIKYFSDALLHFEQDGARTPGPAHGFFPDWGIVFPFAMMTGGQIPVSTEFSPEAGREALCGGRDAILAVMARKAPERLGAWKDAIGWAAPEEKVYLQRDGTPSVIALRWKANDKPSRACP